MGALFVMGLGMGCTMMPLMTAAIVTLSNEQIARGSTLMNIVQQTAGSIGTAVMSVVLTNQLLDRGLDTTMVGAASHIPTEPGSPQESAANSILSAASDAFGNTFLVATVLIVLTLIPAFFLPRSKTTRPVAEGETATPIVMH